MESALFPVPANESTCLYQRRASHGAMAPWPQNAVVSGGGFVRQFRQRGLGGLCGLVGYAGFAMTEVPRYLTCVSYHVAHGKVTTRVSPNEAHTVL